MNNKQYIGRRMSRYEGRGPTRAVDGIALVVDEEHEYRAGDMDGCVMEIVCPYGTQAMADALLAQLKGRTYTAYSAENAVMDPEAELGDGVTLNGVYTLLASRQMVLGSGRLGQIGAPADSEIDHEYGVADTYDRRIERKLAQSRSYIEKTAEEIRIGVEGVQGDVAELAVSVGKVSSTVSGFDGRVSQVEQTAKGLKSTVQGLDDRVSTIEQTDSGITLSVSGSLGGTARIKLSNGSSGSIDLSKVRQEWADDETSVDVYGGATRFYGGSIEFYNNTFIADSDNFKVTEDGTVSCWNMDATHCTLNGDGTTDKGNESPYDAAAIVDGNMYLLAEGPSNSKTIYGSPGNDGNISLVYASKAYNNKMRSAVLGYVPDGDNIGARINGKAISSQTTLVPDSDRDLKKDVEDLPERFIRMLDGMRPVTYRYNWQEDGEPVHWGYIAQEMEEAIEKAGMTREDVAALVGEDGSGQMGIGYTELIPLLHMKIRQLEQRLEKLEAGA